MIGVRDVVTAVGPAVFALSVDPGGTAAVDDVFVAEPGSDAVGGPGDLVLGVGATDLPALVERCADQGVAGLVLRERLADDPAVRTAARRRHLPLVSLRSDVAWAHVVWLLRSVIDRAAAPASPAAGDAGVHNELFALADTMAAVAGAPVTIEDNRSRVLAYSSGQAETDPTRVSTIVGRRVPPDVVAHFRARGVFRRLARSSEPFLVGEGPSGTLPRLVVPVRAGDEWLGSVWLVVTDRPDAKVVEELRNAASVVALHLLRVRAQAEVARRGAAERLGLLLRGGTGDPDEPGLPSAPWRVVALHASAEGNSLDVWVAACRRHGWSAPALTELDGTPYAVVAADGSGPGAWDWLGRLLTDLADTDPTVRAAAGSAARRADALPRSRAQADELLSLLRRGRPAPPVQTFDDAWPAITVHRATTGVDPDAVGGPVPALHAHDRRHGTSYAATLRAWLAHPGEPRRAAEQLHVHPNTLRHRMRRITALVPLALDDPMHRLALAVQLEALAARTDQEVSGQGSPDPDRAPSGISSRRAARTTRPPGGGRD